MTAYNLTQSRFTLIFTIMISLFITACSDDNDSRPTTHLYEITMTNLTNGQPMSPPSALKMR